MALMEIEEADLRTLQDHKALIDAMGKNPATRTQLLQLMKAINPNVAIPEIDAAKPLYTALEARDKKIEALEKRINDKEAAEQTAKSKNEVDGKIDSGRRSLKKQGYTEEGVQAVEKLMQDRGIMDYEAAAALFERTQPKEEPITPSNYGRNWDMFKPDDKDDLHKLLMSDPEGFGEKMARQTLTEIQQNRSRF